MGQERTRQVWRSAGNLLLPQRIDTALIADVVRQEQAGQFEQSWTQRIGETGGYFGCSMDREVKDGSDF
jgi:hypothetical protein